MKQLKSITIEGQIKGTIWMPAIECWKDFEVKFAPHSTTPFVREWAGLHDALEHICNDGDFQSAPLVCNGVMTIAWQDGKDTILRDVEIPRCELTKDYLSEEYPYEFYPYEVEYE
jgi:hypothetical protein